MGVTRKCKSTLRYPLSTTKINISFFAKKYYPTNLWCVNRTDSMNFGDRKESLPCNSHGWLI